MTDFTAAKSASFSQAHRPRHSGGIDHDDPEFFGHAASRDSHRAAERTREQRQGEGPCSGIRDERFFSNFGGASDVKPTHDGPVHRDSGGHPVYGHEISAGSHAEADRIRRRERR
jgi:hypothetical protein